MPWVEGADLGFKGAPGPPRPKPEENFNFNF